MKIDRPTIANSVREALARAPAAVLLGPRQVGKTTLARDIATARGDKALYLDMERPADRRRLDDADDFLRSQAGKLVVLDEIHRTPNLFETLRGIIDDRRAANDRSGHFLLLGSASIDLMRQSSETLAGRVVYLEMDAVSLGEATGAGIPPEKVWSRGGFPESLLAGTDRASLEWRQDFIRSYLERDVPMFGPRLPAQTIGRLWSMLANGQGTLLNQERLASGLGVSAPSVSRYIDLLVDLLLVRRLQPWSGNYGKRLVKSPKIYVRDTGLVHALLELENVNQIVGHPIVGLSWEGLAIETLINAAGRNWRPYFYRTADGSEIDLILERAGHPDIAVEIKRSSAPSVSSGFHQGCDLLGIRHRWLVYSGTEAYPAKHGLQVLPLAEAAARLAQPLILPTSKSP